jgi:hypothetical protein
VTGKIFTKSHLSARSYEVVQFVFGGRSPGIIASLRIPDDADQRSGMADHSFRAMSISDSGGMPIIHPGVIPISCSRASEW